MIKYDVDREIEEINKEIDTIKSNASNEEKYSDKWFRFMAQIHRLEYRKKLFKEGHYGMVELLDYIDMMETRNTSPSTVITIPESPEDIIQEYDQLKPYEKWSRKGYRLRRKLAESRKRLEDRNINQIEMNGIEKFVLEGEEEKSESIKNEDLKRWLDDIFGGRIDNKSGKTITQWAKEIHKNAKEKGFHDTLRSNAEALALIHSEASEALEADRKGRYCKESDLMWAISTIDEPHFVEEVYPEKIKGTYGDELADILIRVLDHAKAKGINIEAHMEVKIRYNKSRPYKHGKKY